MSVNQKSEFGRDEQVASIIGGLAGAVPTGLGIYYIGGPSSLRLFSWLVGSNSPTVGLAVWIGSGVLLGVLFAVGLAKTINDFTATVIMVSQKSKVAQKLLVPLLHRSPMGLTAGSMGLLFGQILGFGIFAYIVPILLYAQGQVTNFPLADFVVIFAYTTYGTTMGTVYGVLLESNWYDLGHSTGEESAATVGAITGGLVGTGTLYVLGGPGGLVSLGSLLGDASVAAGALVYMGVALVTGIAFAWVLASTINRFTNTVIMFSQRSKMTRKLLVPLLRRGALTVTAGSMGLVYGLAIGVVFYVLGVAGVVPQLGIPGLVSFAVFGNVLGNGYGIMMETVDLSLSPSEEQRAGFSGSVIAGVLSAIVLFVAVGGQEFTNLAILAGLGSGLLGGLGVWLAACIVLGQVFVLAMASTVNSFTTTVIMFSRRSKATQKVLVPLLSRAALTVTAGTMGLIFGTLLGVAYFLVMPLVYAAAGAPPQVQQVSPLIIAVGAVFGQVLGTNYGLELEDADLSPPEAITAIFGGGEEETTTETAAEDEPADPLANKEGFAAWRAQRPFAGAILLIMAGFIIGAIPIRLQFLFPGPSKAAIGLVFAAMVAACGVFALVKPELSTLIGVTGIAMSILSIIGAFGGLIIGMIVGIVGGNLCIAWQDPSRDEESAAESRFKWIGEGERQQW
jgi:hypothetical protein